MSFTVGTDAYARHVGRALDVGCGPGVLLVELAHPLGGDCVAGVDPSEPFVEAARTAVPMADVRVAPAEQLPFDTDAFDVVLSQLVVNFMADAEAGLAEMRRVARRTVTSCVWDYAGEMTMLRAFWDAALELDPNAPDEGETMRYCSAGELAALWREVGLREIETRPLVVEAVYDGFDDYWSPFPTGIAPSGA